MRGQLGTSRITRLTARRAAALVNPSGPIPLLTGATTRRRRRCAAGCSLVYAMYHTRPRHELIHWAIYRQTRRPRRRGDPKTARGGALRPVRIPDSRARRLHQQRRATNGRQSGTSFKGRSSETSYPEVSHTTLATAFIRRTMSRRRHQHAGSASPWMRCSRRQAVDPPLPQKLVPRSARAIR
jgi:hypothetical protein